MSLKKTIENWLNQENSSPGRRFFQITALVLGGVLAMILGALLVGVILIASPLITVLVVAFLALYGLVTLFRG